MSPNKLREDKLILTFKIRDREMDIGLNNNEVDSPYHVFNFFYPSENSLVKTSNKNHPNLIKLGDHDSLPPLNCSNYTSVVKRDSEGLKKVYLYGERNPGYQNLIVEFYSKENGTFVQSEIFQDGTQNEKGYCNQGLSVRFPYVGNLQVGEVLNGEFLENNEGPFLIHRLNHYETIVTYTMQNPGFRILYKDKYVKLKFQILDRELNRSNWVETKELVIE